MFITVKLLNGLPKPLTYAVPSSWDVTTLSKGTIVSVPLRNTTVFGYIVEINSQSPSESFAIKQAHSIELFPHDSYYFSFIEKLASYYHIEPIHFIARIKQFLKQENTDIPPTLLIHNSEKKNLLLTEEQQAVVDFLNPHITTPTFTPILLYGVTGSGKSEIYKKAIEHAFAQGKTVLFLLPEVTLAVQFEHLFKQQLPSHIPIISFHSATSASTKKKLWNLLLTEKPFLIVGVHLPVLLPIPHLGLIIVDEEHEIGYQEKKHPKINTRDAAIWRAHIYGIPVLLGSATPSLTTLYNVEKKGWKLFKLTKRYDGNFPSLTFVRLTDKKQRTNFWISTELQEALKQQLINKKQSIIFLNRRGVSFFVQCKECSFVFGCTSCSVSLTLHEDNSLRCHYCGYKQSYPTSCLSCKKTDFLNKGIGTQKIVSILQKIFPSARIERADMDVTINRKHWQTIMEKFTHNEIDILVGTQTITKGYHFPNVTLVGIIWGDCNLHFPFYNAQEATLQQLIQVAGRAGRSSSQSRVIVQTMADHELFNYANEQDYLSFYTTELAQRADAGYPPLKRLAEIELKHKDEKVVEEEAQLVASFLMKYPDIITLGPAHPVVSKIKNMFSRKIYLKADDMKAIAHAFSSLEKARYQSRIFFTPQPLN